MPRNASTNDDLTKKHINVERDIYIHSSLLASSLLSSKWYIIYISLSTFICSDYDAFVPYLTVNYLDRMLSRKSHLPALKRNLRKNTKLFAICCFTLASKMRNRDFSIPNFLAKRKLTTSVNSLLFLLMELHIKFTQFKPSIIPASAVLSASFEAFPTPILQRAETFLRCQYIDKDALLLYMEVMGIEVQ
ncbi:hypothetical protein CsSME_00000307 [Camellia sinensis var. sinensis]